MIARRSRCLVRICALPALTWLSGGCVQGAGAGWCAGAVAEVEAAALNAGPGLWEKRGSRPELRELWRVGAVHGEETFGFPFSLAVAADGTTAIVDLRLREVILVGADGSWRGAVTRQGPGPGEVRWPVAAAWSFTSQLLVFDLEAGKIVALDRLTGRGAGDYRVAPEVIAPIHLAGELPGVAVSPDGALLLQLPWTTDPTEQGHRVAAVIRHSPAEVRTDTVLRVPVVESSSLPDRVLAAGRLRPVFAVGPSGALVLGDAGGRYRLIMKRAPDLTDSLAVCREIPAGEGDAPAFARVFVGTDGGIWVQREPPDPSAPGLPPAGAHYDAFAPDGRYLGEVKAPERMTFHGATADRVYAFETGEYDVVTLVALALRLSRRN